MKALTILCFVSTAATVLVQADTRTSASYSVATELTDAGGGRAASASYTNNSSAGSVAETSTVASTIGTAKQGYIGQLYEVTGIELVATPATVNEGLTRQLSARQVLDDATTVLSASGVTWSVVSGPLVGIDSNGLVTAAKVHADTAAVVQGSAQGFTDTLDLTVLNVATDTLAFGASLFTVNEEAGILNIAVVRTGSTDGAVTVKLSTSSVGGTATVGGDYAAVTNLTVPFAHGESLKLVPVTILSGNATNEANETFTVSLSAPGPGAALGNPTTATVRIIDQGDITLPTAPTIIAPVVSPMLGLNTGGTTNVTGAAGDNKGIGTVKVKLNGGLFVNAGITLTGSGATANYTLPVTPLTGANTLTVQSFDTRGNASPLVTRTFTVARPLLVNAGTALGSVTTGFANTTYREVGKSLALTATAKPPTTIPAFAGAIFTGWTLSGDDVASGGSHFTPQRIGIAASALVKNTLTFTFREGLVLTANFSLNPFPAVAGTYNGLIRPSASLPDRPAPQADGTTRTNSTEGLFKATVMNTGAFSGTLTIDALVLNVAGAFDENGNARFGTGRLLTQTVARINKPNLVVTFQIDLETPGANDKITGTVTAIDFKKSVTTAVSTVDSDRAFYNGTSQVVPSEYLGTLNANGTFTAVFPAKDVGAQTTGFARQDYPQGDGIGTITVTKAGVITVTGTLADGTAVSASSALAQANTFPLFMPLYSKLGFLSGFVQLDNTQAASDLSATNLQWLRPFIITSHYYPYGWPEVIKVDLLGAKYAAVTGQSVLKAANGANLHATNVDGNAALAISDGRLSESLHKAVNISTADVVAKVPDNDPTFTLIINRITGGISGTFTHTDDTTPAYQGMIYQKGPTAGAYGYFLTKQPVPIDYTGESGGVTLIGQP